LRTVLPRYNNKNLNSGIIAEEKNSLDDDESCSTERVMSLSTAEQKEINKAADSTLRVGLNQGSAFSGHQSKGS